MKKGRKPPPWFLKWTNPSPVDDWYMSAFWDLSTERPLGMGAGPIPWSAILRYAGYVGLEPGMVGVFQHIMQAMDSEYMKWQADEEERRNQMRNSRSDG